MQQDWIKIEEQLPEHGIEIDGFNSEWIDEDFNPNGVRPCFLNHDGDWTMAIWNNDQDCWDTVNHSELYYGKQELPPTHWKDRPSPP